MCCYKLAKMKTNGWMDRWTDNFQLYTVDNTLQLRSHFPSILYMYNFQTHFSPKFNHYRIVYTNNFDIPL